MPSGYHGIMFECKRALRNKDPVDLELLNIPSLRAALDNRAGK